MSSVECFSRTKMAAKILSDRIACTNPKCNATNVELQFLGSACKHAFCWDCVNMFQEQPTLPKCPICCCPLEPARISPASMLNTVAKQMEQLQQLLQHYDAAVQREGDGAIAETQAHFGVTGVPSHHQNTDVERMKMVEEFCLTQQQCDPCEPCSNGEVEGAEENVQNRDGPSPELGAENEFFPKQCSPTTPAGNFGEVPPLCSTQVPGFFFTQDVNYRQAKRQDQVDTLFDFAPVASPTPVREPRKPSRTRRSSRTPQQSPAKNLPLGSEGRVTRRSSSMLIASPLQEKTRRSVGKKGEMVVVNAVITGSLRSLRKAIEANYDVNEHNPLIGTPLFLAVDKDRLDMVRTLVEAGSIINAYCGPECDTALHLAVRRDNEEIAEYLLSKGASRTVRNVRGQSPLAVAQETSNDMFVLLKKYKTYPRQVSIPPRLPDKYFITVADTTVPDILKTAASKMLTLQTAVDQYTTQLIVRVSSDEGVLNVELSNNDTKIAHCVLKALLYGIPIVTAEWLQNSVAQGEPIGQSSGYEVQRIKYRDSPMVEGSVARARRSKERLGQIVETTADNISHRYAQAFTTPFESREPGIFRGCKMIIHPPKFHQFGDKSFVSELVKLGEGEVLIRDPPKDADDPLPFHSRDVAGISSPYFYIYDAQNSFAVPTKYMDERYAKVTTTWLAECIVNHELKIPY